MAIQEKRIFVRPLDCKEGRIQTLSKYIFIFIF
jgi:hypothetical protein